MLGWRGSHEGFPVVKHPPLLDRIKQTARPRTDNLIHYCSTEGADTGRTGKLQGELSLLVLLACDQSVGRGFYVTAASSPVAVYRYHPYGCVLLLVFTRGHVLPKMLACLQFGQKTTTGLGED
jgi:hypothetical protein